MSYTTTREYRLQGGTGQYRQTLMIGTLVVALAGCASVVALLAAVGVKGGADVFNTFVIGQMVTSLVGFVPYITMKRRGALPTEAEAEAATK